MSLSTIRIVEDPVNFELVHVMMSRDHAHVALDARAPPRHHLSLTPSIGVLGKLWGRGGGRQPLATPRRGTPGTQCTS